MTQITDDERLRLENEALTRIVNLFATLPMNVETYKAEAVQYIVRKARNILQEVKKRNKGPSKTGDVERISVFVVEDAKARGIADPCVVFERIMTGSWEAYLGDHDEDVGVARGKTAFEACCQLLTIIRRRPRTS